MEEERKIRERRRREEEERGRGAQETLRTAGSSTDDLFPLPDIPMRAPRDWLLKSRARVLNSDRFDDLLLPV